MYSSNNCLVKVAEVPNSGSCAWLDFSLLQLSLTKG
jgi:hypothetical protein